ncbi:hypothetical protein B0H17DRAFT_1237000, partial [Mycena rosella]
MLIADKWDIALVISISQPGHVFGKDLLASKFARNLLHKNMAIIILGGLHGSTWQTDSLDGSQFCHVHYRMTALGVFPASAAPCPNSQSLRRRLAGGLQLSRTKPPGISQIPSIYYCEGLYGAEHWGPNPLTLFELSMHKLSWALRSKPEWQRKAADPRIRAKWRQEALAQMVAAGSDATAPKKGLLSEKMV